MTAEQLAKFVAAARGTSLEAMWITAVMLGLRPGEVAALSWGDIDFDTGIVHIRSGLQRNLHGGSRVGVTKTPYSIRSLDAPAIVLDTLRAHRVHQAEQRLETGALWRNENDLAFTSPTGAPSDPTANRREFRAVVKRAQVGDGWTPNMLRHTTASLLSDAGVPLEVVADQLGHRDTRMASRHYRHRVRPTVNGGLVLDRVLDIV
jgi:integrase